MNIINTIKQTIFDRALPIEARIGVMYVTVGVIAAFLGGIICLLAGTDKHSIIIIACIGIVAITALFIGYRHNSIFFARDLIVATLVVAIPGIFITAGGMNSGCPAWMIYQLCFIALSTSGLMLYISLALVSVIDLALFIADFYGWSAIFHLESPSSQFISIVGSWVVVAFAILLTFVFYKLLYNTERQALEEKSEELALANKHEKMFLANMSHELRTPMNSIIGFNEMILRTSHNQEVLEYANNVSLSSEHLLSLVNDILDLSKIEAGEMSLNVADYSITEVLKTTYNIVCNLARDKGLMLAVKLDPNLPKVMLGDRERIMQMTLNIVSNAIKYTTQGTVTVEVEAGAATDDDLALIIRVTDTGMGISEDNIDKIFNVYGRVGNTKTIQGTGLGLPITKMFTELMGGKIYVTSQLDKGSCFTIIIPQKAVTQDTIGPFDVTKVETPNIAVHDSSPRELSPDQVRKILVCDDNPANLAVMRGLLKNSGHKLLLVNSGAAAIKAVEKQSPDLIFMDIMMPEMNGEEALAEIIKIDSKIPVIALTADAFSGARERYMSVGFADYLTKPIRVRELDELISQYLS